MDSDTTMMLVLVLVLRVEETDHVELVVAVLFHPTGAQVELLAVEFALDNDRLLAEVVDTDALLDQDAGTIVTVEV